MKEFLDVTIQSDLIEAMSRAAAIGFAHAQESVKPVTTDTIRREVGIQRWRGGYTATFSTALRAVKSAYNAGYENGHALESDIVQ